MEKIKLKTRAKIKLYRSISDLVEFLFRVKLLKDSESARKKITDLVRNEEKSFVGGRERFELKEIRVELINRCNTDCIMCPRDSQKRKAGKMDVELYEKLIKEAYGLGARALYPYHMGESLIIKDFCKYIKIAGDIGYTTIMLTTTGGLIKQYDPEELATCGLTIINFSIDSTNQESYKKIRTNMKLTEVEESIKKIIEAKKKLNPSMEVSVKFMDYPGINDGEWPVFENKWDGIADRIYHTTIHDWGERSDLKADPKLPPEEYCRFLRQKLIFGWDGTAMFCCMDYDNQLPIGKYPEQSLKEIMNSPVLFEARKMHRDAKLYEHQMCSQCYMTMDEAVRDYYKVKLKRSLLKFTDKIRGRSNDTV